MLLTIITAKKTYAAIPLINVFLVIAFESHATVILTAIVSIIGTAVLSLLVALYVRNSSNRIQERKELEDRLSLVETQVAVLKDDDEDNEKDKK